MIEIFVYPDAWPTTWHLGGMFLVLMTQRAERRCRSDHWIARQLPIRIWAAPRQPLVGQPPGPRRHGRPRRPVERFRSEAVREENESTQYARARLRFHQTRKASNDVARLCSRAVRLNSMVRRRSVRPPDHMDRADLFRYPPAIFRREHFAAPRAGAFVDNEARQRYHAIAHDGVTVANGAHVSRFSSVVHRHRLCGSRYRWWGGGASRMRKGWVQSPGRRKRLARVTIPISALLPRSSRHALDVVALHQRDDVFELRRLVHGFSPCGS